ncbi:MAG: lysostaphin resistance A-like protein, partial [Pseudoxanthomonas sp.]
EWADDAITKGEELIKHSASWPVALRAELLAKQAGNYSQAKDQAQAKKLSLQAARLGDSGSVPKAVEELLRQRDQAGAARLLRDTAAAKTSWAANSRLEAALKIEDPAVALAELHRYDGKEFGLDGATVARVHLKSKDAASARKALAESGHGEDDTQVRFDTAVLGGDVKAASAQVHATDVENLGNNIQRFAVLLTDSPSAIFQWSMMGMAMLAAVILLTLALMPGALLVPVHYRGLMRRVRGRTPLPLFPSVGLRHAWWGLALLLALPFLVAGVIAPRSLAVLFAGETLPAADALFRLTLWSTVISLLLLSPIVWSLGRTSFRGDGALLRQAGWVLAALLVLYAVAFLQGMVLRWTMKDTATIQTEMIGQLLDGGKLFFGAVATFTLMAVLVPIFEELVFRCLLLGGMARHISFGWANLIQALLFATAHGDPPRFFFYFTMGLLAGGLVRKTRSLTPAIALHAINNGVAFLLTG